MVTLPQVTESSTSTSSTGPVPRADAALVTVRFGEFLRERQLIDDEQWLAALAFHWSALLTTPRPRRRFGDILVELGVLASDVVEHAAEVFHDGLDVVEVSLPSLTPARPRLPSQA
jgi:hypothetical protein